MILSGLICGALLGFVMQRGRFCLTGGFRDMYLAKNNRMFYALLIAISVQSVGVFALIQAGLLTYEAGAFPWLGTVIGGYIFGLGIVLAGGCATGTWYRAGEGLIGSWIALFTYMVMSAVMRSPHASGLNQTLQHYSTEHNSIAETFNLSVAAGCRFAGDNALGGDERVEEAKTQSRDLTAAPNRDRSYSV